MPAPINSLNNIDTTVIVVMENRSVDAVIGHLRQPSYGNRADLDGLDNP